MQPARVLLDTPPFAVSYDSENRWLYVEWRDKQDVVSSLASFSLLLRFVRIFRVQKLLCDSSQALDGWDGIGHWVSQSYLPSLAQQGICAIAWVNAADWATKDELLTVLRTTPQPSVVVFDHLAGAYDWLQNAAFPFYQCASDQADQPPYHLPQLPQLVLADRGGRAYKDGRNHLA
ncbi:hypothetical protein DNI29_21255 [Hymenobacter sediminis]|uniref:hypothetical protein n=1 Tax=Hymenobacter sediminis TaxID=2218621 RepID=UPI000F4FFD4A|nr:hypothetical protein [Hymenobacter sediminis]RPD44659.1 hypothetical protein DNI29_21255 [Hymenobacter sediminis]